MLRSAVYRVSTGIVLFMSLGLTAFAEPLGSSGRHPCMVIKKACEDAHFEKGEAKNGNGLFMNCMKPLMEGKAVPGVQVESSVIEGCRMRKEKK